MSIHLKETETVPFSHFCLFTPKGCAKVSFCFFFFWLREGWPKHYFIWDFNTMAPPDLQMGVKGWLVLGNVFLAGKFSGPLDHHLLFGILWGSWFVQLHDANMVRQIESYCCRRGQQAQNKKIYMCEEETPTRNPKRCEKETLWINCTNKASSRKWCRLERTILSHLTPSAVLSKPWRHKVLCPQIDASWFLIWTLQTKTATWVD